MVASLVISCFLVSALCVLQKSRFGVSCIQTRNRFLNVLLLSHNIIDLLWNLYLVQEEVTNNYWVLHSRTRGLIFQGQWRNEQKRLTLGGGGHGVQEAEPLEAQGFYAFNYGQMR